MKNPWIQVSIDTTDLRSAKKHIEHALAIDAEWIEVGTPLLTFESIRSISAVANLVGERTIVADFKAMDGVEQYFAKAADLGANIATVMAVATEASIIKAIEVAHKNRIKVQVDLLNVPIYNMTKVVQKLSDLGADYFLLHLAIDELFLNPNSDPLEGLDEVVDASSVPVGPVVFSTEQGVDAINRGASYVVVGYPFIGASNARSQLRHLSKAIRSADQPTP